MKAKILPAYTADSIRIQRSYSPITGKPSGFMASAHDPNTIPFTTCVLIANGTESDVEELLESPIARRQSSERLAEPNYGLRYCDIVICDRRTEDFPDRFLITDHKNGSKALRNATEVQVRQFLRSYLHGTKPLQSIVVSFINGNEIMDACAPQPA